MHKYFFIIPLLFLTACATPKYNDEPLQVISNESGTKIYLNDEYSGTDLTYLKVLNKYSSKSFVKGVKKNCREQKLQIEHKFDWNVLNILNPKNIVRLFKKDVYIVDTEKTVYNVTPFCE